MIRGITIFSSDSDINDEIWNGDGEYLELYNSRDKPDEDLTHAQFINILARLTIYGMFGNGATRSAILGVIYEEVQKEVNRIYAETGN